MPITLTGELSLWTHLKRMYEFVKYGTDNGAPNYPLVKNNESVLAVNAAGTGTVGLIKASATDVPTIGNNAVMGAAGTAAGSVVTIDGTQTLTNKTLTDPIYGVNTGVVKVAHAKYDFAVDGGAQGAITPAITASIPAKAIILSVVVNSTTAVTSGGAATVAAGTTAGSSATALLGATAIASLGADALVAGVPVPNDASKWVKMTAAGSIDVTVATADLTAGVIEIWAFYVTAAA